VNLRLRHVQCDEIWTFVEKKESRIPEASQNYRIGDQYVFIALDTDSKLIATCAVGKRSSDMARRFMVDLAGRLRLDNSLERPTVQLSTDGFKPYVEAVDLAFEGNVLYGQIIKVYHNANRPYTPCEIVGSKRKIIYGPDRSAARSICTSHVERTILTIRTFIRRFTRLRRVGHAAAFFRRRPTSGRADLVCRGVARLEQPAVKQRANQQTAQL
jgi:IS1 family transposase